jgi:hypothetical protein
LNTAPALPLDPARALAGAALARRIAAGWPVGAATGLPWLVLFVIGRLVPPSDGPPEGAMALLAWGFLGATVVGWVAAGVYLGRAGGGRGIGGAVASGGAFLLLTLLGLSVAARLEGVALGHDGGLGLDRSLLPLVLALAFGQYLALTLGGATLVAGLVRRVDGAWPRALGLAGVVFVAYLVVALALNLIPEWRVGGGHAAMVKVVFGANLIVGTLGGAAALRALRVR